jgi:hypothetical protein
MIGPVGLIYCGGGGLLLSGLFPPLLFPPLEFPLPELLFPEPLLPEPLLPDPLVVESVLPELLLLKPRMPEPVFPPMPVPPIPARGSHLILYFGGRVVDELPLVVVILLFVEQDGLLGAAGGEADDAPSTKGLSAHTRR